jgi:hypothetical protein
MYKLALTALVAGIISAATFGSATAMTLITPNGLRAAIEGGNIVEDTRYVCRRWRSHGRWHKSCSWRRGGGYYRRGVYIRF